MRESILRAILGFATLLTTATSLAQPTVFDVDAYQAFLGRTTELSTQALLDMHPAGPFLARIDTPFDEALYADTVAAHFRLTDYEIELVRRHGFMVTERVKPTSFGDMLWDIYVADLPVYFSADAMLHAIHMSYDAMLQQVERTYLSPLLSDLLAGLHAVLPPMAEARPDTPEMRQALKDLDAYLTMARSLLAGGSIAPLWPENLQSIDALMDLVAGEKPAPYSLFATNCRIIDFSQFTPRGHYTQREELTRYFQAMIWLGRTELYLTKPKTTTCQASDEDVARQTLMAALLVEALSLSEQESTFDDINSTLALFVGEEDNVTPAIMQALMTEAQVTDAADLTAPDKLAAFQEALAQSPLARQRINSQILFAGNIREPEAVKPAGAFMLLGQRFVIDSFVTGHVVFAEVEPNPIPRLLPSSADVLYSLGNDAAAQLLVGELDRYGYAPNLAALRYLIDSYGEEFWSATFHNGWLDAVRTLNPPSDRSALPRFAQTAAWWQQKMTTQLAAWAQIRHDNLLYAKQSYTGGLTCYFPYSLVEPNPAFFEAVVRLADNTKSRLDTSVLALSFFGNYLERLGETATTLRDIAQRQVNGMPMRAEDHEFMQSMINEGGGSGPMFDGWYPGLFFNPDDVLTEDLVVADIHTAPTDLGGHPIGWVVHAGTGPLNLAVVTRDIPGVGPVAFAGPVMSYYEHVTTDFERLSDEVWRTAYSVAPSMRPDFVNLYMADGNGESRGSGPTLHVGVEEALGPVDIPRLRLVNYPNPFKQRTTISFDVPRELAYRDGRLEVFDVLGRKVRDIPLAALQPGVYSVDWSIDDVAGSRTLSGAYYCRVTIGGVRATRAMMVVH